MAASVRSRPGLGWAARLTTQRPGTASPFVSQSQLLDLLNKDRSDIARQLRHAERLAHHPHRGMPPNQCLLAGWQGFLLWMESTIRHLEQPRPVPELEHLIRTWQDRRGEIVAPGLRWRRRADVIAVEANQ